jgi:glycosyltransferase involved in cell wall biosynthesis
MKPAINTKMRPDIIVFSHLRWDSVTQRPQHILNLLSKKRRILFVEEPAGYALENKNTATTYKVNKKITVLQPHITSLSEAKILSRLVKDHIKKEKFVSKPIVWFYSPQFIEQQKYIDHSLVVYDCMDELSTFAGAPADLRDNEKKLLSLADVVFTGGKSIYESKIRFNINTHCFPSSVDQKHFRKTILKGTKIPADIKKLKKPVIGYYGVIDERIDYGLLKSIAEKLPDVSFVMIGPVIKVDPQSLPKLSNIYYLGKKDYQDLPNYLKAFDIAMMPFALNAATKFISPTKTLEYMAGEKLIVSTPIKDVERDYKNVVSIATSAEEFAKAITKLLKLNKQTKEIIVNVQNKIIARTSWKNTVSQMETIIANLITKPAKHLSTTKNITTTL